MRYPTDYGTIEVKIKVVEPGGSIVKGKASIGYDAGILIHTDIAFQEARAVLRDALSPTKP
jgi:hypothetical protein